LTNKKLYIIRHGETAYNKLGIVQGSGIDAPLNETGKKQALLFYERNKYIGFDKIYTSTLLRAQQSVTHFLNDGIPHIAHSGLNEISWGEKEGHEMVSDKDSYYKELLKQWQSGNLSFRIKGGESPLDVAERQKIALQTILADSASTILICMHGRAMRILLSGMLNTPLHKMDNYHHSNLCMYVLTWDSTKFILEKANIAL